MSSCEGKDFNPKSIMSQLIGLPDFVTTLPPGGSKMLDKTTGILHYTIEHYGCPWYLPFRILVGFLWGLVIGRVDDMGDLVDAHFASNLVFRKVLLEFPFFLLWIRGDEFWRWWILDRTVMSGQKSQKFQVFPQSSQLHVPTYTHRMRPKRYGDSSIFLVCKETKTLRSKVSEWPLIMGI